MKQRARLILVAAREELGWCRQAQPYWRHAGGEPVVGEVPGRESRSVGVSLGWGDGILGRLMVLCRSALQEVDECQCCGEGLAVVGQRGEHDANGRIAAQRAEREVAADGRCGERGNECDAETGGHETLFAHPLSHPQVHSRGESGSGAGDGQGSRLAWFASVDPGLFGEVSEP
jgi:hypothetical protein